MKKRRSDTISIELFFFFCSWIRGMVGSDQEGKKRVKKRTFLHKLIDLQYHYDE